ncbi:DUF6950 family protein [Sphingobium yanoikuyae]|uniref:DUF6950 family protein n=1 Tax=Sphingobium yanoikuyae TaxID=13690 RepID=UPI00137653D5|nr:hypothetical protein [Sphingobium yanoikuyae]NBB37638.1 hypothetical protein [Sphingobium yanoikuyae]
MRDFEALDRYLAERAAMPFQWGKNDCVSFYAGAAKALCGARLLKGMRWGSEAGAARLVNEMGGLKDAISSRLAPIEPAFAQRGDAAGVHDERFGLLLMVVEGSLLVGPGNGRRLMRAPRSAMLCAWSLPRE